MTPPPNTEGLKNATFGLRRIVLQVNYGLTPTYKQGGNVNYVLTQTHGGRGHRGILPHSSGVSIEQMTMQNH